MGEIDNKKCLISTDCPSLNFFHKSRTHPNIDSGHAGMCIHWPIVEPLQLVHRPIASLAYSELTVDQARDPSPLSAAGNCALPKSVFAPRL